MAAPAFLPRHRPHGPQHLGIWGKCGVSGITMLCIGQPRPLSLQPLLVREARAWPAGQQGQRGSRDGDLHRWAGEELGSDLCPSPLCSVLHRGRVLSLATPIAPGSPHPTFPVLLIGHTHEGGRE